MKRLKLLSGLVLFIALITIFIYQPVAGSVDATGIETKESLDPSPVKPIDPDPQPIFNEDDTIDIGPVIRAKDLPIEGLDEMLPKEFQERYGISNAIANYSVGDEREFLALDDYNGNYFFDTFTVMTMTGKVEVWVQNDLNYYNLDGTLNPVHPDAKDPLYITEDKINYLASALDDYVIPTDTKYFGQYDFLNGSDSLLELWGYFPPGYYSGDGDRVIILVQNVRDDNFYDPINNGSFIAGFYSPTYEAYMDRNIITIDSKQWNERVGPGGSRPYGFDSTIAHELQHLIHDDYDSAEESWVNEGLSEFAEFLVGYRTEDSHSRTQWQTWPENSLTVWGDRPEGVKILADYQQSYLFQMYLTGQIGGVYTDTAKLVQEELPGILGINAWLQDISATNPDAVGLDFDTVFDGFRKDMLQGGDTEDAVPIANWNSDFISNYTSPLEMSGGAATSAFYTGRLRDNLDIDGYADPGVPAFGTDFVELLWSQTIVDNDPWTIYFDGDETPPATAWAEVDATDIYTPSGDVAGTVLYSGHEDFFDNFVVFGPVTPAAADNLSFDHFYNIEDEWDYGFVQVTTDLTGLTGWTSLDMTGMITETDSSAHPIIVANVPGFSGFSDGWESVSYPLGVDYQGQSVLIAFRYSSDWGSAGSDGDFEPGWAIDNVKVGATTFTDGGVNGGESIQEIRDAGAQFDVEFLTWVDGDGIDVNNVYTMTLDAMAEGSMTLPNSDAGFNEAGERGVIMVSSKFNVYDDLIGGGVIPSDTDYALWNVPPSVGTSNVELNGREGGTVYAGEVITASVFADNIGASPNITTSMPISFYIGVEIPDGTTVPSSFNLNAATSASYVADLSTVSGAFPAVPGMAWIDIVTDTQSFDVPFVIQSDVQDSERITVTVHYADDESATPDQYMTETDYVTVSGAFELSAMQADTEGVLPSGIAEFSIQVINKSENAKEIQLDIPVPDDTTIAGISVNQMMSTDAGNIVITQVIPPYSEEGATTVTLKWQLGSSYIGGDVVESSATITDTTTNDEVELEAVANVLYGTYLPLIAK